jgi:hypothetical protein
VRPTAAADTARVLPRSMVAIIKLDVHVALRLECDTLVTHGEGTNSSSLSFILAYECNNE